MIHCYKCGADLPDNLNYCLHCGGKLDGGMVDETIDEREIETVEAIGEREIETVVLERDAVPEPVRIVAPRTIEDKPPAGSPARIMGVVGLLVIATMIGLLGYSFLPAPKGTDPVQPASDSAANANRATANSINASANAANAIANARQALANVDRALANVDRALENKNAQNSVATTLPPPKSGDGWFIILGSYAKFHPERATDRIEQLRDLGIEASIVDTDNYPGFNRGLYAVVLGPFSKAEADSRLASLQRRFPVAYAKSGY